MAGIRLWRCSHCEHVAVVVDKDESLLCGDCFLDRTVNQINAAVFLPAVMASSSDHRAEASGRGTAAPRH